MKRTTSQPQLKNERPTKTRPSPPLVVRDFHDCSYEKLLWLIANLPVCRGGRESLLSRGQPQSVQENNKEADSPSSQSLPLVLIEEIASYHTILPIVEQEVTVVGVSSHDGIHSLQACLDRRNSNSWWLSSTLRNRPKPDSVHFRLNTAKKEQSTTETQKQQQARRTSLGLPRRLREFRIEIPPLPMGPCSVREIQLQVLELGSFYRDVDGCDHPVWRTLPETFVVNNQRGMQPFVLSGAGLDIYDVKVICCSNQMEHFISSNMPNTYAAVGFSSIQFL